MKTYINFNSTIYKVDTTNKVIVCIIEFSIAGHPFKCVGKARCNKEDVFDEVKGRRIAESRAKTKVYKKAAMVYNTYAKALMDDFNRYSRLDTICSMLALKENKHVEFLCGE